MPLPFFKRRQISPEDRRREEIHAIYTETLGLLNIRLLAEGFELERESHGGLGALALYRKGSLVARLFMDLRDAICVFSAESGTVRHWSDAEGREMSSKYDLYIYLSEAQIRPRFPAELERWLGEHR